MPKRLSRDVLRCAGMRAGLEGVDVV